MKCNCCGFSPPHVSDFEFEWMCPPLPPNPLPCWIWLGPFLEREPSVLNINAVITNLFIRHLCQTNASFGCFFIIIVIIIIIIIAIITSTTPIGRSGSDTYFAVWNKMHHFCIFPADEKTRQCPNWIGEIHSELREKHELDVSLTEQR